VILVNALRKNLENQKLESDKVLCRLSSVPEEVHQHFTSIFSTTFNTVTTALLPAKVEWDQEPGISTPEAFLRANVKTALADLERLRQDKEQYEQRMEKTIEQLSQQISQLQKQNQLQEEQLRGKRALWMARNPQSGPRRDAMAALTTDPFSSPTPPSNFTSNLSGYGSPSLGGNSFSSNLASSSFQDDSMFLKSVNALSFAGSETPTHGSVRRRGVLPSGKATTRGANLSYDQIVSSLTSLPHNTEPGSPEPVSHQMVVHQKPTSSGQSKFELASKYEQDFKEIFAMAEKWCVAYASIPNLESERKIQNTMPVLWDFMMNCTYPNSRPDSNVHVSTLLQDSKARFSFCERMMITYFTTAVLVLEEFEAFSPDTAASLRSWREALNQRGLASEIRRSVVLQYSKLLEEIAQHPSYAAYQNMRITFHSTKLRGILGPLLNTHAVRNTAGVDLGRIVKRVWDLSVAIHTSYMTFQIYFPETNSKFNAATMWAKDQPGEDQTQLQFNQLRLKLVITPVITVRDDSTTSIRTQNLHKAVVLTMA